MTMDLTMYEINILDYQGRQVYQFTNLGLQMMQYDRLYNDIGSFSCVLVKEQAEWAMQNLLLPTGLDYMAEIYRLNPKTQVREKEDTFFIRLANPYYAEDFGVFFMVIGGPSLDHLLTRRAIVPDEDPIAAGGYVTDAGDANRVISRLVEAHLGGLASDGRRLDNLEIRRVGEGDESGYRSRFDGLLDTIQKQATAGRVQFKIRHEGRGRLRLVVGQLSRDLTLDANYPGGEFTLLRRERGNLTKPSLILDYQEQKTVVYVRGKGNDDNETVLQQHAERDDISPYNRIEFVVSGGRDDDEQGSTYLLTEGKNALKEAHPKIEFTFPVEDLPGFEYRVDYDIGDLVTADWEPFKSDLRVTGMQAQIRDDSETLKITVESEKLSVL